jgi:RNA polymerase sigma factor (TIGR02999 family)
MPVEQPDPSASTPEPPEPGAPDAASIDRLLERAAAGQPGAAAELLPLVYEHLRALARAKMANELSGQSLPPTALVHEAYLKILGAKRPWNDKRHFFAAAALAMRRILVDRARARNGPKRGVIDGQVSLEIAEQRLGVADTPGRSPTGAAAMDWLALEAAMEALENHDAALAEVVHLRYFAGLTVEETALALGVSSRSINRDWMVARAWLLQKMKSDVV